MGLSNAIDVLQKAIQSLDNTPSEWSIVVLDRGWVFVGKLGYSEDGTGFLHKAANIRRWGTTKGIAELQTGPTTETILDPCAFPVRFTSSILTLDVAKEGWENAY